jgi:hypothetical protein
VHAWLARVRGRSNDAALAALSTWIVSRSSTEALSSGSSILRTSWRAEELLQAITEEECGVFRSRDYAGTKCA